MSADDVANSTSHTDEQSDTHKHPSLYKIIFNIVMEDHLPNQIRRPELIVV